MPRHPEQLFGTGGVGAETQESPCDSTRAPSAVECAKHDVDRGDQGIQFPLSLSAFCSRRTGWRCPELSPPDRDLTAKGDDHGRRTAAEERPQLELQAAALIEQFPQGLSERSVARQVTPSTKWE